MSQIIAVALDEYCPQIGANKTKIVYQGGHVKFDGTYEPVGIMAYSGFAVDCQTWGMSTLIPYMGMEWLESHLGPQGGYRLFQEVKSRGGHFINDTIAGVGFTQVINQTCVNVTCVDITSLAFLRMSIRRSLLTSIRRLCVFLHVGGNDKPARTVLLVRSPTRSTRHALSITYGVLSGASVQ